MKKWRGKSPNDCLKKPIHCTEAVVLTVTGGIAGVMLGYGVAMWLP